MTSTVPAELSFDLVVPTVGRTRELEVMVESVRRQGYPRVRLLVVDQNRDARATDVLDRFRDTVDIVRLPTDPCGTSVAKNLGLERVTADVVAFPDDDCWYPDGLLRDLATRFASDPGLGGLTMPLRDAEGRLANGRWASESARVTRTSVWGRAVAAGIFYRREAARAAGSFDEELGPGSGLWLAGEETDQLIRVLDAGYRVEYDVTLHVHHPDPERDSQDYPLERWTAYAAAMGHVMRKHRFPARIALYHCARPVLGVPLALLHGDAALASRRLAIGRGRFAGWRGRDERLRGGTWSSPG
jgi:glycosyltransferase involved in cell wall biosynthesis